ncbi:MAG TPA: hypothetical protein VK249_06140 [Anaerolineales bacterium]|nr:hypothetical protein [Anaerolineales bacterium]
MFRKRVCQFGLAAGVLIISQVACSVFGFTVSQDQSGPPAAAVTAEGPGADAAAQPTVSANAEGPAEQEAAPPSVPGAAPTPTPFIYQGKEPASGTGGVYGRLLWNGEPVEGVQVKLCDEIKFIGGCKGAEYPTVTDAYGVYTILNVPPGSYGLTYRALDADTWYFVTSGILNAKDFEITAGQMVNVGDHHTVRLDVVILSPTKDERLSIARPTISWQPYPSAAYYELTLHSDRGGSLIHRMELTATSFTLDRDLQTCDYSFNLEVFNAQGIMIAENDGWHRFKVAGLPQSCKMVALTPADGASVPANKITLTWQPHDWAAVYKIHMVDASDSNKKILDFVETNTTSYTVTQNVPAGQYEWVVYAYDEFGDGLGFTDRFTLYVTNP